MLARAAWGLAKGAARWFSVYPNPPPNPDHRTEKEKMLAGDLYDPADPELLELRARCRELLEKINYKSSIRRPEERKRLFE